MRLCQKLLQSYSFVTLWTITHPASLSMEFSRQDYWSGLLFLSPEDLPNPGIELWSPALRANSLPIELQGSPWGHQHNCSLSCLCMYTGKYQLSSVTQLCPTLCDPMDHSIPGFPGHHQPLELAQIHVHRVSDAIQLSSPSLPAFNVFQHQGLLQ